MISASRTWWFARHQADCTFYFRQHPDFPVGTNQKKIGPTIDHRGHGGLVVWAGFSIGEKVYKLLSEPIEVDKLPVVPLGLAEAAGKAKERAPSQAVPLVELDL